jgi:hypothetical protein
MIKCGSRENLEILNIYIYTHGKKLENVDSEVLFIDWIRYLDNELEEEIRGQILSYARVMSKEFWSEDILLASRDFMPSMRMSRWSSLVFGFKLTGIERGIRIIAWNIHRKDIENIVCMYTKSSMSWQSRAIRLRNDWSPMNR